MCFGHTMKKEAIELRPSFATTGIQQATTLEALDYEAFPAGIDENPAIEGDDDPNLEFYTIYHRNAGLNDHHIALLGARWQGGLLVVSEIYTDRDARDRLLRPRAAAILLSFWRFYLGRPIASLRTVFFKTVTEDTMNLRRPEVYRLMGKELWEPLTVRRSGNGQGERAAFKLICDKIKFGKCAKLMESLNQEMKDAGIRISHFKFRPQDESRFYFNFLVEFRVYSSQHHGGHHRHR